MQCNFQDSYTYSKLVTVFLLLFPFFPKIFFVGLRYLKKNILVTFISMDNSDGRNKIKPFQNL